MIIKILTPETVIFEGTVDSVLLPGKNGDFHIMNNHIAIVSSLVNGKVRLFTNDLGGNTSKLLKKENDPQSIYSFEIKSGVIEFSNNKGIILAE